MPRLLPSKTGPSWSHCSFSKALSSQPPRPTGPTRGTDVPVRPIAQTPLCPSLVRAGTARVACLQSGVPSLLLVA